MLVIFVVFLASCDELTSLYYKKVTIKVSNQSSLSMEELYIVADGDAEWGSNLLTEPLVSGGFKAIEGIARDKIDIRCVFSGTIVRELQDVDVQKIDILTLLISEEE